MKLFITHVGRMMLKDAPIFRIPMQPGKAGSVFVKLNKYVHIYVNEQGIIYAEHQIAAYMAPLWDIDSATLSASRLHLEIVGILEYTEYRP